MQSARISSATFEELKTFLSSRYETLAIHSSKRAVANVGS